MATPMTTPSTTSHAILRRTGCRLRHIHRSSKLPTTSAIAGTTRKPVPVCEVGLPSSGPSGGAAVSPTLPADFTISVTTDETTAVEIVTAQARSDFLQKGVCHAVTLVP